MELLDYHEGANYFECQIFEDMFFMLKKHQLENWKSKNVLEDPFKLWHTKVTFFVIK